MGLNEEETLLRDVALRNANSILTARLRAERELVAAKQTLHETAERLRAVFEQAAVGIAIADLEGRFIEVNERFAQTLGYTREELVGRTFEELTHADDKDATARHVEALLSGNCHDYVQEKRYVRRDGGIVWSRTSVSLLRDASGEAHQFIGAVEDVTAKTLAEAALRRNELFNRTIIESSRDCMMTLALDGTLLWISDVGRRELGLANAGAELGSSWPTLWRDDEQVAVGEAIDAARRGGEGRFVGALEVDGRTLWWNVLVTPIVDTVGEPEQLLAVCRDITDRKKAELALHDETRVLELLNRTGATLASNLEIEALLQAVTDAATEISGAQFGAFFYNAIAESGDVFMLYILSGAPREAFEGFGQPRATPMFGPTFRGEGAIRIDNVREDPRFGNWGPHHGMPPGHLPVVSYLAVPVISRGGEVFGGLFFGHEQPAIFTERTERIVMGIAAQAAVAIDNARLYAAAQRSADERKELLESERHARLEAERASSMKDEFLATLSHELRTPLSAILGWSQLLRMRSASEEEIHKGLETIERNARMQTQLIEDLLDMSRITSGKLRLDSQIIEPVTFIEEAIESLQPAAAAKGIHLMCRLDREAGPVLGDAGRLQQVVWNLVSNALKFTPRDGAVDVQLERVKGYVEISVTDTGKGIAPDFLPFVFDRFRQADSSMTRTVGGLGLGLSIVKQLVEMHGGSVQCTSSGLDTGARFIVQLPVATKSQKPRAVRNPTNSVAREAADFHRSDLSGIRILVVDDSPDSREIVKRVLAECDAEVLTASSAAEAMRLLESQRLDVLLSDIGMPDVNGYEFLKNVRALSPERGGAIPAIALTAFARSEDRTRALRAGFLMHVAKPVEPAELVATVASVVGRAVSNDTNRNGNAGLAE